MRLLIASDLHLEFGSQTRLSPLLQAAREADLLLLAGDLVSTPADLESFLRKLPCQALIVAGNHEFYGHDITTSLPQYQAAAKHSGCVLLEKEQRILGGVRFVGCTLWTDLAGGKQAENYDRMINDRRWIRLRGAAFTSEVMRGVHQASVRWLESALDEPFDGPTVVMTHHAPSYRSSHPRWAASPINGAFSSNLDDLVEQYQPDLWVHGHHHDPADYRIGRTRILCNAYGYDGVEDTSRFKPDLLVEIDGQAAGKTLRLG